MAVWLTSDSHFGHDQIRVLCNRPFASVDEMDTAMIERWNAVVHPGDCVYHLGDFSFHPPARTQEIVRQLNGQKFLVLGNHDRNNKIEKVSGFIWQRDLERIKINDPETPGGRRKIVLCHYALRVWDGMWRGAWQVYGHSHGGLPELPDRPQCDVGVDSWNFTPVSYDRLKEHFHGRECAVPHADEFSGHGSSLYGEEL